MGRFTIANSLWATALIAVLVALSQAESCASRASRIRTLNFSPDGKRIAVARYNARQWYERTSSISGAWRMSSVSRTISMLDAAHGDVMHIVDTQTIRDFPELGWRFGVPPLDIDFMENRLLILDPHRGGVVARGSSGQKLRELPVVGAANFAISSNQRFLLSGNPRGATLSHLPSFEEIQSLPVDPLVFLPYSPALAISSDNELFAVASTDRLLIGKTSTGEVINRVRVHDVRDLSFADQDKKICVFSMDSIELIDVERTQSSAVIVQDEYMVCNAVSSDGNLLAFNTDLGVKIFNLATSEIRILETDEWCTALCFSPDGSTLAVGDQRGNVTLFDMASFEVLWKKDVPGRFRPSWLLPGLLLLGWIYLFYRLVVRRKQNSVPGAENSLGKSSYRSLPDSIDAK